MSEALKAKLTGFRGSATAVGAALRGDDEAQ